MMVRADAEFVKGAVYPASGGGPVDAPPEKTGRVLHFTGQWDGEAVTGVHMVDEREPSCGASPPAPGLGATPGKAVVRGDGRRGRVRPDALWRAHGAAGGLPTRPVAEQGRRRHRPDLEATTSLPRRTAESGAGTGPEEGALMNVSVSYVTPGLAEALLPVPEHLVAFRTLLRPDVGPE